jgi:putative effector of murein hydrolase
MVMKNNSFASTFLFLCAYLIAYELPFLLYLKKTEYNVNHLFINAAVLGITLALFKMDLEKYALGKKILQHERALALLGIVAALQAVVFLVVVLLF